jgi:hypothetical protein
MNAPFDRLLEALQRGDAAVVLTHRRLALLTAMVGKAWQSEEEFEILQELKNLTNETHPCPTTYPSLAPSPSSAVSTAALMLNTEQAGCALNSLPPANG